MQCMLRFDRGWMGVAWFPFSTLSPPGLPHRFGPGRINHWKKTARRGTHAAVAARAARARASGFRLRGGAVRQQCRSLHLNSMP